MGYTPIQLPPYHFRTGRVRYDSQPHMAWEETFLFFFGLGLLAFGPGISLSDFALRHWN
jgi:hypothetical protein